ncbi:MAG: histidine phosphotransferase family protein [Alphaproteobacteria bacterium]|jgi:histidine phosphotransferase ChpT|nr:hypothetical protein [Rhodospirillaceae bacterium]MBT6204607.1 hypothetical protein [Rhodospirillaceae bacterium]MBT7615202.1 hypothetical protein [Rhodospirillaceae bacterium]MBT7649116.1 hypothetical protein [Rhodospirillaceae bacterium]MDG2481439.1 histidine phosphotransferase family protein [Alphaproteobacteria bacterium]
MSGDRAVLLAGLICSRLCHDVVGPAGAIANGLELCADPEMVESALGVMRSTSDQLNRRLSFYRRAYGTGSGLTWDEAHELTQHYVEGGRHEIAWSLIPAEAASPGEEGGHAKLVMNMVLCALSSLPAGGLCSVTAGIGPVVSVEGTLGDVDAMMLALASPDAMPDDLGPREVQPHLTGLLANDLGGSLMAVLDGADRLSITFRN